MLGCLNPAWGQFWEGSLKTMRILKMLKWKRNFFFLKKKKKKEKEKKEEKKTHAAKSRSFV